MSLEYLDAWLHALSPPRRIDGASLLDGYLTIVIIGPCSFLSDEWFVDLLGESGCIATASDKTLAAMNAIVARLSSAMASPPR